MSTRRKTISLILIAAVLLTLTTLSAFAGDKRKVGKNPGQTKGRWLEIDVEAAKGYQGVYLGEITSDIQWKDTSKETPIDERMLNDKIKEYLLADLRASGVFDQVSDSKPENTKGMLRLDCDLQVDPGNRALRYVAGFGAGKSKSIFEIHLVDPKSGKEIGLYHGYGTGSGMGFKLAGGGARKMTEDDIQENSKKFAELLQEVL